MCVCMGVLYAHMCMQVYTRVYRNREALSLYSCVCICRCSMHMCMQVNTCVCRKRGRTFSTTVLFLEPLGRLGLASPSDPHVSAWHRQCCDSMQALPCPAVCVPGSQPSSSCLHSTCPYPENHLSNTSTSLLKVNGDPKKFFI
jgi:hypothetical protein